MTSESTTRWPLLDERVPFAHATHETRPRRRPRSTWLLVGLAFLCGGLVSAAGFSIGWRHQAQRGTAAEAALATATARTHGLERRLSTLQASLAAARAAAASAAASERALRGSAAKIAADGAASSHTAASVSSEAGSLSASASRVASELRTLETYLTTTPAGQLDPGYVTSQTTYLSRQLSKLQTLGGNLGDSVASFEAAVRKLTNQTAALSR
jgi:hypothetical protein